jgi:hypothetical protein
MKSNCVGFVCNRALPGLLLSVLLFIILILSLGCESDDVDSSVAPGTSDSSDSSVVTTDDENNNADSSATPNTADSSDSSVITTVDKDNDGIADSVEEQLIQRFAPVVKLHFDAQYMPASIPWYLARVRMRFDISYRPDEQLLEKGSVNLGSLISQTCKDQMSGLAADPSDFFLEQTDASGGDILDEYREETQKGTGPDSWVCYAHVRLAPANIQKGMYDVQYIFFYAYNGDMVQGPIETAHEADFEHITVRVEEDLNTIYKIYYSAHDNEGRWYDQQTSAGIQNGYSLNEAGRPIVYSAINSHASYPWAGQWARGGIELPDDETSDGGFEWDCQNNVVNLGEKDYPREGMQWIQYSGRWGEIGEMSWTTGPYGPAYQSWWNPELE